MQTVRLPQMPTVESAWDALEILFEELRCECFYEREEVELSSNEENVASHLNTTQSVHANNNKKRKISTSSSESGGAASSAATSGGAFPTTWSLTSGPLNVTSS